MKKFSLKAVIIVFLLISSNGIQAQNANTSLDQFKLQQQFIGTWQANAGKDTVEIWEIHQYGKAFIDNVYQVIRGQKTPLYIPFRNMISLIVSLYFRLIVLSPLKRLWSV
jgi:hypothetical protein